MAVPTLEPLDRATITFTGTTVTIMFRDRDRLSSQLKQMVSHQMKRPILFIFQTSNTIKHEWWSNGLLYNPFGAAIMTSTDTGYIEHHHKPDGRLGCNYGPASIEHKYGQHFLERWISDNGHLHREDGGPAKTEIEFDLNVVDPQHTIFSQRDLGWYRRGSRYCENSWAQRLESKGIETFETIPPMGLMRTLLLDHCELSWYGENNKLHRTDGPASLIFHDFKEIEKDGRIAPWQWKDWSGEWHVHGTKIPNGDILKWAKKNNIPMWNEPCYNRSVFREEDGEFCFITDFLGE